MISTYVASAEDIIAGVPTDMSRRRSYITMRVRRLAQDAIDEATEAAGLMVRSHGAGPMGVSMMESARARLIAVTDVLQRQALVVAELAKSDDADVAFAASQRIPEIAEALTVVAQMHVGAATINRKEPDEHLPRQRRRLFF